MSPTPLCLLALAGLLLASATAVHANELGSGDVYGVIELRFTGPGCGPKDTPARDIDFSVRFRHESGGPEHRIPGFWDGDGAGGDTGSVFVIRFCPTKPGRWDLVEVSSNKTELDGQKQGHWVTAAASPRKGFWIVDEQSPGRRWYQRSDGSHAYIFGNTMYSFVSERNDQGPNGSSIAADVKANRAYFNKLRFGVHGDRYVHPADKPFFDDAGRPTDSGAFAHRPNPAWFHRRVDTAVRTAYEVDCIADLILNGPDTVDSRSLLVAKGNGGNPTPYLRYVAARYAGYPNVWFCVSNEWDIKNQKYEPDQIARYGQIMRKFLTYPTPLSVHGYPRDWNQGLNTTPAWQDHTILQGKIKKLGEAADFIARNHTRGEARGQPVINDELGYEGAGDKFTREDIIEGHLGAFLGGGYGTTGHKPGNKTGHYFWGAFKAEEHTAARHLKFLREGIDRHVRFWELAPVEVAKHFDGAGPGARAMASHRQIVLGTNAAAGITARLPEGGWRVVQLDAMALEEKTLADAATGAFRFQAPASRAVLFVLSRQP